VGFPAKSGVAGGILAVLPGQLGIGVFSPRLDARGNSVRGVAVCSALSEELELHSLRAPRATQSVLRSRFTLRDVGSKRMRLERERAILAECGDRVVVYRVQGDLGFTGMELVVRCLASEREDTETLVLDLGRATEVDDPAARLLFELAVATNAEGRTLVLVGLDQHPRLGRFLDESRSQSGSFRLVSFDELDLALEWCEERLLEGRIAETSDNEELPLAQHSFLEGLTKPEIEHLTGLMERREFQPRAFLVRKGDPADALFFLVHGRLSVLIDDPRGRMHRLATLSPGMGFGEPSLVESATRGAFVRADRASVCWVLKSSAVYSLEASMPVLKIRLLENLLRSTTRIVNRLSRESISERS
jgi:glutaminase